MYAIVFASFEARSWLVTPLTIVGLSPLLFFRLLFLGEHNRPPYLEELEAVSMLTLARLSAKLFYPISPGNFFNPSLPCYPVTLDMGREALGFLGLHRLSLTALIPECHS